MAEFVEIVMNRIHAIPRHTSHVLGFYVMIAFGVLGLIFSTNFILVLVYRFDHPALNKHRRVAEVVCNSYEIFNAEINTDNTIRVQT